MGVPFKMAQPMIPGGLLHTMYEVQAGGHYDQDKGCLLYTSPSPRD